MITCYDKRSFDASPVTIFGVEGAMPSALNAPMIGAAELLDLLRRRGVKNAEIGQVLDLPSSRVSELFSGKRRLQLDEAKRLVERYQLEESVSPLNTPIARLLVLHAATSLGARVTPDDPRIEELAQDFRAFSEYVADPEVRSNVEAVRGFFLGRLSTTQDRATAS